MTIPVPVHFDAIIGHDTATLPARKDVWVVRQLSQLRPGEDLGAAGTEAAHLAGVEFGDEQADGGVQLRQAKGALIAQSRLDPALAICTAISTFAFGRLGLDARTAVA